MIPGSLRSSEGERIRIFWAAGAGAEVSVVDLVGANSWNSSSSSSSSWVSTVSRGCGVWSTTSNRKFAPSRSRVSRSGEDARDDCGDALRSALDTLR
jgi:hypothetical protein